jgi:predicted nucleotide-binding protein (sugar kinase/HSP70/actin superfamily)
MSGETMNRSVSSAKTRMTAPSVPLPHDPVQERIARERERLLGEAGLTPARVHHFRRPSERSFSKMERDHVTVLLGGLTARHDQLMAAGIGGLGYKTGQVPIPRKSDFQAGREYGNNGQCNPTYFTVGALINHLKRLRDEQGMSVEDILKGYAFLTAGSCGPCRFGMYEAEYRLALRNAGFDGFRVLVFQQDEGLRQGSAGDGMEWSADFFLALLNAVIMADLMNEVAYHVRPYEVEPGKTGKVLEKCLALCADRLRTKDRYKIPHRKLARVLSGLLPVCGADDTARFLEQIGSDHYTSAFEECAKMIDEEIEVDYTRPKPLVKITGEIWAQTTEGDGNFKMFSFLEKEGAEVLVEPITTWISYVVSQAKYREWDRHGLDDGEEMPGRWEIGRRLAHETKYRKKLLTLGLAQKILSHEFERLRVALGGTAHRLADQLELVRMAHPFYNSRATGGEGHLEVAKNIYYMNKELAHMVLSLKPFGCMPSTQSDGAQSAVITRYPDMNYLPVETSGEGDIGAYSRVQMALGEAKNKCKEEYKKAVAQTGYSLQQIREYVFRHRELRRPLKKIARHKGIRGRAANFILDVGFLMEANGIPKSVEGAP